MFPYVFGHSPTVGNIKPTQLVVSFNWRFLFFDDRSEAVLNCILDWTRSSGQHHNVPAWRLGVRVDPPPINFPNWELCVCRGPLLKDDADSYLIN